MSMDDEFDRLIGSLDELQLTTVNGRITETVGMLIKAIVPQVKIGEVCLVKREGEPLRCEVVGFTRDEVYPLPSRRNDRHRPLFRSHPHPSSAPHQSRPPAAWTGPKRPGRTSRRRPSKALWNWTRSIPSSKRPRSPQDENESANRSPIGVRAIDAVLTTGLGQRVGIFAAAGGGKSTLLGMIARNASRRCQRHQPHWRTGPRTARLHRKRPRP